MLDRVKNFIAKHDTEIALTVCITAGVLMGVWVGKRVNRGDYNLELSQAIVNDLLNGKDVLLDCLEDAHLFIKYIPKV